MLGEPQPLHVLIADDHALFRAGLKYLLADLDEQVAFGEANSLDSALQEIARGTPDLLLLDLMMPGMGEDGLGRVLSAAPELAVVVLSMKDHPADIRAAIGRGARGYVPKSCRPEIMLQALKLVVAGGVYIPSIAFDLEYADAARAEAPKAGPAVRLTPRQQEILGLIADGDTTKEIARKLNISIGTVKVHTERLLRSLGARNRTEAATWFASSRA